MISLFFITPERSELYCRGYTVAATAMAMQIIVALLEKIKPV
jgi:DNA-binding winged helix-turn-helix (wHTH) protein